MQVYSKNIWGLNFRFPIVMRHISMEGCITYLS